MSHISFFLFFFTQKYVFNEDEWGWSSPGSPIYQRPDIRDVTCATGMFKHADLTVNLLIKQQRQDARGGFRQGKRTSRGVTSDSTAFSGKTPFNNMSIVIICSHLIQVLNWNFNFINISLNSTGRRKSGSLTTKGSY